MFVLVIGSIIGLMSTTMLQSMIAETWVLRETYQSYYNAKAGTELWNLAVARHDYGYSDDLSGWSAIIAHNLLSGQWDYGSLDLTIASHIASSDDTRTITLGASGVVAFCDQAHAITLIPGWSWIMPLYADHRTLLGGQNSNEYYSNMIRSDLAIGLTTPPQSDLSQKINYSIIMWWWAQRIYDAQDSDQQQKLSDKWSLSGIINNDTLQKFFVPSSTAIRWYTPEVSLLWLLSSPETFGTSWDNFNYLAITNTSNDDIKICIQLTTRPWWYTTDTSSVTSIGRYKGISLWLQSTIIEWLSQFILANQAWAWSDEVAWSDIISTE